MYSFARPARLSALVLCFFVCLTTLCACGPRNAATALSVVTAMTAADTNCPAGDVYLLADSLSLQQLSSCDPSDTMLRVADDSLLSAAFGSADALNEGLWQCSSQAIDDGALRFATAASPCEWIVFHCVSRSDTTAVADLFLHRLELLRRQYRGSDDEALLAHAQVVVIGKYVLLIVSNDPEGAIEAAKHAIS